jgi:bifunctional oligoribonuclease and PAP phosphatase NrnA
MSTQNGTRSARELVLDALRDGERFLLTTHEHPDGDALGSPRQPP